MRLGFWVSTTSLDFHALTCLCFPTSWSIYFSLNVSLVQVLILLWHYFFNYKHRICFLNPWSFPRPLTLHRRITLPLFLATPLINAHNTLYWYTQYPHYMHTILYIDTHSPLITYTQHLLLIHTVLSLHAHNTLYWYTQSSHYMHTTH